MNNFKLENLWYQLSSFHWRFCHITLLTFAQPILTNLEFVDDLVLKIVSSLMTGTTADDTEELLSRFLDVEGANNLNRNLMLLDNDASIDSTAKLLLGIYQLVEWSSSTIHTTCPLLCWSSTRAPFHSSNLNKNKLCVQSKKANG